MRHPTIIAILSVVLFGASAVAQAAETPATRPNVVILLTDDQGMLDANCYGSADLELCGIKQEANAPKLDGHSLTSVISDSKAASGHQILHFAWAENWAVRRGDWKLINQLDKKTRTMGLSLHNLADPMPELKDHTKEQPAIVKELMALHEAWEKDLESK